ncbi:hypothetical protein WCP94_001750 [Bilophila wadsworthia]
MAEIAVSMAEAGCDLIDETFILPKINPSNEGKRKRFRSTDSVGSIRRRL